MYLCLLDGSSKRRLRVTCPDIERCPPECILLGAGANEVCVCVSCLSVGPLVVLFLTWHRLRECVDRRNDWLLPGVCVFFMSG